MWSDHPFCQKLFCLKNNFRGNDYSSLSSNRFCRRKNVLSIVASVASCRRGNAVIRRFQRRFLTTDNRSKKAQYFFRKTKQERKIDRKDRWQEVCDGTCWHFVQKDFKMGHPRLLSSLFSDLFIQLDYETSLGFELGSLEIRTWKTYQLLKIIKRENSVKWLNVWSRYFPNRQKAR